MKLHMLVTVALAALFSANLLAADEQEAYEADCKRYAIEDGVAAEEMEDYLAQCVADMAAASEAEASAQQGSAQE